jgi:3'-phosphoadenosine 5'-phosphosulfate (PAPS) 3'-phosphatase
MLTADQTGSDSVPNSCQPKIKNQSVESRNRSLFVWRFSSTQQSSDGSSVTIRDQPRQQWIESAAKPRCPSDAVAVVLLDLEQTNAGSKKKKKDADKSTAFWLTDVFFSTYNAQT